jgi:glycerol-1-phosphate dehydrogenase [NAD(P)+]
VDLFEALGPAVVAELSARRETLPRALLLGDDAAAQLGELLAREVPGRRAVLLSDRRTRVAAGDAVRLGLQAAGFDVHEHVLDDPHGHAPVCDDLTRDALGVALPATDVLVGVGSGVINDLTKWLAFDRSCASAVFATAASMNGYTAANVAPAIAGVKTLFAARTHRAVAADPRLLAAAPFELTAAGLGDVIAKSVSTMDWRINHTLFGEPFSEAIAGVVDRVEGAFLGQPERLAARDPGAVQALFEALIYSGCAMTLQGSSLPASGGEHLISHSLDMRADAEGGRHDLHGRQVGLGTIFAAAVYERVAALESPALRSSALPLDRQGWGSIADSVATHHAKQTLRMQAAAARLAEPGQWDQLRALVATGVPRAAWLKDKLQRAGAAHRIEHLGIERERFRWAVLNCAQMRERFTSIDLGWVSGVLPGAVDEILDTYLA